MTTKKEIYSYCLQMTQGPDSDPLWVIMEMIDPKRAKEDVKLFQKEAK